jgi:hypothetical protein
MMLLGWLFRIGYGLLAAAALAGTPSVAADADSLEHFSAHGIDVSVELDPNQFSVGAPALMGWVKRAMDIVSTYYGRFPADSLRIRLVPQAGGGVQTGKTWGYRGGYIRVQLGRDVNEAQLRNDWVLVHEMTHLALPDVGDEHAWLSEGLAVYIEGVERVQAGNRTEQDVFAEQLRSMPRGLPQWGDHGLDHTHTWGRTYWGGAIFCFLADVQIRQKTGNRLGLQDAMRAVLDASGGLKADWPISRVLATADQATGTHVLEDLYAQMKDNAVTPDLPALWKQLGVDSDGGVIRLRDDAPLAAIRRAIMRAPENKT